MAVPDTPVQEENVGGHDATAPSGDWRRDREAATATYPSRDIPDAFLRIEDLTKSYGAVKALRGVSFGVRRGEVLALIGDNGAGKTTVVKCLSGIVVPDSGRILVGDEPVEFSSPADAQAAGIETVHQDLALIDSLDVTGNLFLHREIPRSWWPARALGWMDKSRMNREAKEILESLHISIPSVRTPIEKLSGGQRQAIAVGRAVAWGRGIVLMDEPSAALGVEQTELVLRLIEKLRDLDIVVVLISHNMQNVIEVCSRAVVLRHGVVAADVDLDGVEATDLVNLITGASR